VGSVSDSIALHANVPVLVARTRARAPGIPLNVLMAIDGGQACREAADLVNRLSWPPGTCGQVMTVAESIFGGEVPPWLQSQARQSEWEPLAQAWVREHDVEKAAKAQEMADLCASLPRPFQQRPPLVCEGHPAEQILNQISNGGVDLVILGARRLGPVDRWLGSTSLKVLHHAACSVLIVREHERP
jgi:nucleotide-binding universal stress UspA family protein